MRSTWEILNLATDRKITTQAEATQILDEEAKDYAELLQLPVEQTRRELQTNLAYVAFYLSKDEALRILELFQAEHPIFGRTWPTPEEAVRLSHEYTERRMKHG